MWRFLIVLLLAGCASAPSGFADHQDIEGVLSRANRGFEVSDPELFANAFADDATYELTGQGPVFGYERMKYVGRGQIREILTDRINKAQHTDPKTLSYDPASLRRFDRNSDEHIELIDSTHARHTSTWMVVMHTNVNIHISAVGRYEDDLIKRGGKWYILKRVRSE